MPRAAPNWEPVTSTSDDDEAKRRDSGRRRSIGRRSGSPRRGASHRDHRRRSLAAAEGRLPSYVSPRPKRERRSASRSNGRQADPVRRWTRQPHDVDRSRNDAASGNQDARPYRRGPPIGRPCPMRINAHQRRHYDHRIPLLPNPRLLRNLRWATRRCNDCDENECDDNGCCCPRDFDDVDYAEEMERREMSPDFSGLDGAGRSSDFNR